MSRALGFVCADLLPLLLESAVAPYREAAVRCLHLAEEFHQRGWRLAFLTPVAGHATGNVIASRLGPVHLVDVGGVADGWWRRWRTAWRVGAAMQHLGVDIVVRCDAPAPASPAPWQRRAVRIVQLLTGERPARPRRWDGEPAWLGGPHAFLVPSADCRARLGRARRPACVVPPAVAVPAPPRARRHGVTWVSALDRDSGADVLLDLADAFPERRFAVYAQGGADPRYIQRFEHRARQIHNVALHWDASYEDVVHNLARARLLVSTARSCDLSLGRVLAWMHGAVVVSLASDPDALLGMHGLGVRAADPHELFEAVRHALEDQSFCDETRARARRYAEEHFDVGRAASICERLFDEIRPT